MPSPPPDWLNPTEGESILWIGHPRRKSLLVWAVLAAASPVVVGAVLELVVGLLVGAVTLSIFAWMYLSLVNTDYVLTDRAVYRKTGVLGESVQRVPLGKVQNTDLSKGVFGSQFGYGTVEVSSAGSGGTDLRLADVYDPEEVRQRLESHAKRSEGTGIDGADDGTAAAGTVGIDPAAADRALEEARELRKAAESLEETFSGGKT